MQDDRDQTGYQGRVLEWVFMGLLALLLALLAGLVLLYVGWADEAPICTSLGLVLLVPVAIAIAWVLRTMRVVGGGHADQE